MIGIIIFLIGQTFSVTAQYPTVVEPTQEVMVTTRKYDAVMQEVVLLIKNQPKETLLKFRKILVKDYRVTCKRPLQSPGEKNSPFLSEN